MTTKTFSMREAVRFGWDTMKANLGFFIGLLVVVMLVPLIPQIIADLTKERAPIISLIVNLIVIALQMILGMGLVRISLRFCSNEKGQFSDLWACLPLFWKYLAASILYALMILGGLILLIVPGIIWGVQFQFFSYLVIEKGLGPIEALKKSSAITKGARWNVFKFDLLLVGIVLLGLLALLVGLFAAIPTSMVAMAFVYRKLLAQTEGGVVQA